MDKDPHAASPATGAADFQPEVIARSVYWVAHHPRREFTIGLSAVQAILGDKFVPGLLDHYLAAVGYEGQQTQELVDINRPNNLYDPLPGDYGARGQFGNRAAAYSVQAWANRHRRWLVFAGVSLAVLTKFFLKSRSSH